MNLTRESLVIWIGLAAALLTYLGTQPDIREWAYKDYIALGSFVAAWLLGKLQSSPLPGKHDENTIRPRPDSQN